MTKNNLNLDTEKLTRKFRTNVPRIISAWKKGLSDFEISLSLGIDFNLLQQIKREIEIEHLRLRYQRWLT
ncbi:MAG: hypothetical protein ACYDG6_11605 [Thermincolia bacterium]